MPDTAETIVVRLDDSDAKAKIQSLNEQVDLLTRKLQGLSTGAASGAAGGVSSPNAVSTPPINSGSSRASGALSSPSVNAGSAGFVPVNDRGIPTAPMIRTASDGTKVSYNPATGSWSVLDSSGAGGGGALPPGGGGTPINSGNGGGSNLPMVMPPPNWQFGQRPNFPVPSMGGGGRGGNLPVPYGTTPTGAVPPPWGVGPDGDLDAQGATFAGGGRGGRMGMGGLIGAYMMGSVINQGIGQTAQNYLAAGQTGRPVQPADWYGLTGAGIGTAFGIAIGGLVGGPLGAIAGGSVLGGIGNTIGNYFTERFKQKEDINTNVELLKSLGTAGAMFIDSSAEGVQSGTNLALAMSYTQGRYGATSASSYSNTLMHDALGSKDPARISRARSALDATAKAVSQDIGLGSGLMGGFNQGEAFGLLREGGPDALIGYLEKHGKAGQASQYMAQLGASQLAGTHAELMGIMPQQAAAVTTAIAARGGNASQISSGMDAQVSALQGAAGAVERYIKSMEALGTATDKQRIPIETAKAQLAGLTAQIAVLGNQAATIKSGEAIDIAGTGLATASAGTTIGMMTMGRGGNVAAAYAPQISAASNMVGTLASELNRPGLRPEQRREIERNLAGARVNELTTRRNAASAEFGFPAQLASLDAQYSGSYATIAGMGEANPVTAAGLLGRVAASQGHAAGAAWSRYRGMSASGLFNAAELGDARNSAWSMAAQSLTTLNASSQFSPTPTQEAALAGFQTSAFVGMQSGGSMGALAGIQSQIGAFGVMGRQASQVYSNAIAGGTNPAVAAANYNRTAAALGMSTAQAQAALGNFQLSPAAGSALDAAQHGFNMMMASPFVPGNRLQAGTDVLNKLGAARAEAQKYMETADLTPQGKRNVQSQIYGYQEEEQRLRENLNVGWIGRIASREIMAPSHGAMVGVSNRDFLNVDPTGNRLYGSASRRSYDFTEGAAMAGTAAASQPGNMNAQAQRIEVELIGSGLEVLKSIGIQARVSVRGDVRSATNARTATG